MQNNDKYTGTRYSEAEKRQIVKRILDGESVSKIAQEKRISQPSINRWVKQLDIGKETGTIETKIATKAVDKTELEELRKQVKALNMYITKLERHIIGGIIKGAPLSTIDRVNEMYGDNDTTHH